MRLITLCLTMVLGLSAAERHNVADISEKVERSTAKAMWASNGIENLSFPQAPGILSALSNGDQFEVGFSSSAIPAGSYVIGEIIAPSGEIISTDTYQLPTNGGNSFNVFFELWNGAFPGMWQAGVTRFRAVVSGGGRISEADAYVLVRASGYPQDIPVVSITPSPDGSQLTVSGLFTGPQVGVNGTPATIVSSSVSPTGNPQQASITLAIPTYLPNGNGVLTVCDGGQCSQTFFHVSPTATSGKG